MNSLRNFSRVSFAAALLFALLGLVSPSAQAQVSAIFPGTTTVGTGTQDLPVNVTLQTGGTIASVKVMTRGKQDADYTAVSGGTCLGQAYGANQSCTLPIQFKPTAPGERRGAVLLLDGSGGLLGTQTLYGVGSGSMGILVPGTISTVAGISTGSFYKQDGVPAVNATIYLPQGIVSDDLGNIYLSDFGNNRVRRVDAQTGLIATVAGNASSGIGGDNGPGTSASVAGPTGIILDGAGNVLFADQNNAAVRKLNITTGILSTIVGQLGTASFGGDGGLATSAHLDHPQSLALDAQGNLYISDRDNSRIRKVDAATGIISTFAGTGVASSTGDGGPAALATLNQPAGIATDAAGDLYIAELGSNRVRKIDSTGTISTVVGTGSAGNPMENVAGTLTPLRSPLGVAVDVAGNLYVADTQNHVIRKLSAVTNIIATVVGTGVPGAAGDNGSALAAGLNRPYAISLDMSGNLLVADTYDNEIRAVKDTAAQLKYNAIKVGRTSPAQLVTVENDGNADLHFTGIVPDADAAIDAGTTTCSTSTPLPMSTNCFIAAEFSPQRIGSPVTTTIQVQTDAANTPDVITLSGESDELEPTTTLLTANTNPASLGAVLTFTAVVSGNGQAPAGNVKFYDGTTVLGTVVTSGSTATFSISTLALGAHTITAAFTGDATNSPSTSDPLTEVIKQMPTISMTSSLNPSKVGQSVTFVATVTGPSTPPGGTITFNDGANPIGSATVNVNGTASFATTSLTAGTHSIVAAYSGDTGTLPGNSAVLSQAVNLWSTSTTLTSNNGSVALGTSVTFSVHVTPTSSVAPRGMVLLNDGGATIATLTLDGSNNASYTTSALAVGTHTLVAVLQADTTNDTSTSAPLSETIQTIGTSTQLVTSANPVSAGATLHLTATVTAATTNEMASPLSGIVTFKDGATTLGAATISMTGVASLDVSTLSVSTHALVAVYGGAADYAQSTSNTVSEVVQLATTSVQLTSNSNPSLAGKGVTLTAVVSGSGGIPGGTVTFLNGGATIGTGAVGKSGQATLTTSSLPTGSLSLTAAYGGDLSDSPSTSAALTQVVQQATTAITLISSSNPSFAGATVTFVATLTSNGGLPSGQIVLSEGGTILGSQAMNGTGAASFSISSLAAGSHALMATFAGDADHAASNSNVVTQVVQNGTSAVALVSSKNPSVFGDLIALNVKVTGTANQPAGTVALMDQGTTLGTVTLNAGGLATYTISTLAIGDHALTAVYSGDSTHAGSMSVVLTQRVQQATTTTLASCLNPSLVGGAVTLTATLTGASNAPITGTVSFADGATVIGSGIVANGAASVSLSTLVAGTHLIVATYSGDATNKASVSATLSQVVNAAGTTVTLTSNASPATAGTPVSFVAAVSSAGKAASGTVTFLDGSATIGTGAVTNGTATFTTSSLVAGQHAIVARYGGDAGTQVSTSNVLLQVIQNKTGVTMTSNPNPALTLQSVILTVTVSNGAKATGVVTFTDGGTIIGSVSLGSNGVASLTLPSLAAGSHALAASYGGDSYNLPSTTATLTETVQLRATTTVMATSSSTYLSGQQVTLIGVVHGDGSVPPTGTVTFMSGTTSLGSAPVAASGIASLTFFPISPSYSIVAIYSGDAVYAASTADASTISGGPSTTFTLTATPSTFSMASGTHAGVDLKIASVKGFADTLNLGCLGLPAYATCTFSVDKPALASDQTQTVHLTIDTGNPLGIGATAKVERKSFFDGVPGPVQAGLAIPGAVLCALLIGWARRKRSLPRLLSMLVLVGMGLSLTSCANQLTQSKTPAGSYIVRVVASGAQSGASQVADLTVTVTP